MAPIGQSGPAGLSHPFRQASRRDCRQPLRCSLRFAGSAHGLDELDALLPESDVVLTNSHGVFDTTLPEYLLALMLGLVKDVPGTVRSQAAVEWRHRLQEPLAGLVAGNFDHFHRI